MRKITQVFLDLDAASGQYAESRGGPVAGQTRISLRLGTLYSNVIFRFTYNIYKFMKTSNLCSSVFFFVCPIITKDTLDLFASNFDKGT